MEMMQAVLGLATFLCSLVAGFLFAFAVVVMLGISGLDDKEFIKSFQGMDRIIQNNQPLFLTVWVGSIAAVLAAVVLGFWQLDGTAWYLLVISTLIYLLGVHLPTVLIHLPLNNQLQAQELNRINEQAQADVRNQFERRWNLSNIIRTSFACLSTALLVILLLIL